MIRYCLTCNEHVLSDIEEITIKMEIAFRSRKELVSSLGNAVSRRSFDQIELIESALWLAWEAVVYGNSNKERLLDLLAPHNGYEDRKNKQCSGNG